MPEMMAFCGEKRRVAKWATSVCLQDDQVRFGALSNCVILEMPRCDGEAHGGCQMGCRFFWKTQWLESAETCEGGIDRSPTEALSPTGKDSGPESDSRCHRTDLASDQEFRCQATELSRVATSPIGLSLAQIATERDLNGLRFSTLASGLCSSLLARLRRSQNGLSGPCRQTPVTDLKLAVDESVVVRTRDEIIATLDESGKNRGLWFDPLMLRYCGETLKVRQRVDRFISERTGRMVEPSVPSVVLDDLHCEGTGRKFCSRGLQYFWRECWLRRI